jgi:endoplasmic reticulum lectin 1
MEEDKKEKIPTWHFNGFDYPYHKVEMTGGTPCDLRGNNPRSVSILYICQTDAQTYGMLLLVEESTACHYVAMVGSKQLCQNTGFRLKEQPVYTISCYPEGSSPKKPGVLREQEFDIINMTPKQATTSDPSPSSGKEASQTKASSPLPGPSLDVGIILTGEMCLRGGSGWWIHELCLMKQVKQIHQEDNVETQILLGVWNEDAHREWYEREGRRKHTSTSVSHLYKDGDVCDLTGKPRLCYVKFKCSKRGKSLSQISIHLTEQTLCTYVLTVEGHFVCPLLEDLDDHGLFHLREPARLFEKTGPAHSSSSEQSHSGTESGPPQAETDSSKQSRTMGTKSEQEDSGSSKQAHSGTKSGQSQADSSSSQQSHSGTESGQSQVVDEIPKHQSSEQESDSSSKSRQKQVQ